jgi:predicted Rossmann fold flavoprotein
LNNKVIVIGAGAAGLMASWKAAERGREVLLLEKNNCIGKKILISGKGRCNITNNTDIDGLIRNIPGNGNFLYSSFYTFSNKDMMRLLQDEGLEIKVERGGRVFPASDRSKDVVNALQRLAERKGVKIMLNTAADSIMTNNGSVCAVRLKDGKIIEARSAVIATGGVSYPGTGSTGDGYEMAKKLGHTVTPLKPSLVPLITAEKWIGMLQGLTLKNISITVTDMKGKKIYSDFGEMLFTHFGVSGPVILSASRHILPYDYKNVRLSIDLKPALDEETLDARIRRDFEKYSRKQFKNSLDDLLPKKMIPVVVMLSGIDPEKPVNQITKAERRELLMVLKNFKLEITGARPISEAIVTAGGICTDEINPSTMESKLVKGLYFAGEVIDVDGYTGGFNLTIAFSTGYLAGMNC